MTSKPQHRGPAARTPQPVYEDFKPTSRWREDGENHILTIDLPRFLQEQVKVSTENQNIVRVRGERPVRSQNVRNRRARFQEDYQVPKNGDMGKIRARFDRGALIITIGKKIVDKPQEVPPAKPSIPELPKQDKIERPPEVKASQDEKSLEPTSGDPRMKQNLADVPREGRRGTPFSDAGRVFPQDYELKEKHVTEEALGKEEDSKRSEALPEPEGSGKTELKAVNKAATTTAGKEDGKKSKGKHKIHTDRTDIGVNEAVNGLTKVNDERQSLVNMGAAVLVIMTLSAYVSYQFASGKNKN